MSTGKTKKPSPSPRPKPRLSTPPASSWTFLTNHSHVLICLAINPDLRVRDIADIVAITERAVLKILAELEEAGVITREREGRRTRYEINGTIPLRHPVEAHRSVKHLLGMIKKPQPSLQGFDLLTD